jgi:type IV secretion system protein VirD4
MRADEQIVFTAGNAPLRCGRAIWFRRADMKSCVGESRFQKSATTADVSLQTIDRTDK